MAQFVYEPGVQNEPLGNINLNPEGSNYPGDSAYAPEETNLIQKAIERLIFDAAPKQYAAMKILFQKPVKDVNLDEFEYLERTFGRTALTVATGSAAVVPVPGAFVTTTFTVTAAGPNDISISDIITFPDGTEDCVFLHCSFEWIQILANRPRAGYPISSEPAFRRTACIVPVPSTTDPHQDC